MLKNLYVCGAKGQCGPESPVFPVSKIFSHMSKEGLAKQKHRKTTDMYLDSECFFEITIAVLMW